MEPARRPVLSSVVGRCSLSFPKVESRRSRHRRFPQPRPLRREVPENLREDASTVSPSCTVPPSAADLRTVTAARSPGTSLTSARAGSRRRSSCGTAALIISWPGALSLGWPPCLIPAQLRWLHPAALQKARNLPSDALRVGAGGARRGEGKLMLLQHPARASPRRLARHLLSSLPSPTGRRTQ
jgi:hypothetical protein